MNTIHAKKLFYSVFILLSLFFFKPVIADIDDSLTKIGANISMGLTKDVPLANIVVNTGKGILQVAGFVDSSHQYKQVIKSIEKYRDKYNIVNSIIVLPINSDATDEADLRKAIESALRENKFNIRDIKVQVRGGAVILSGFINKNFSITAITKAIEHVPGVVDIHNHILYK